MTARNRLAAIRRRWRVRREYQRLIRERLDMGYNVTRYHEELYRAEAERRVP